MSDFRAPAEPLWNCAPWVSSLRRRVETRDCDIADFMPPSWEEICTRRVAPWERERLDVETAGWSVEEGLAELLARLDAFAARRDDHRREALLGRPAGLTTLALAQAQSRP